jgi:muramoyltetrapeptide carboxypeptidase
MIIPPYLKEGDDVILIATARKISIEELKLSLRVFQSKGLNVLLGQHVFDINHQFAGTDQARQEDLQWALNHPTAKAIVIARGGYGSVRLLPDLDFSLLKKYPKWLVGYSDVTVLHNAFHNNKIATLHATMPLNFKKNEESTQALFDALFGNLTETKTNLVTEYNKVGTVKADLVGGNLSLLYSLSGTPFDIQTDGKILFIEDLDEYLYHLDRMMMQLKLSGKLKNLAGLIVGGMSDMKDNAIPFGKTAEHIIHDAIKEYDYPVCFQFPAGHSDKNLPLYLGKSVTLKVQAECVTLTHSY